MRKTMFKKMIQMLTSCAGGPNKNQQEIFGIKKIMTGKIRAIVPQNHFLNIQ